MPRNEKKTYISKYIIAIDMAENYTALHFQGTVQKND